MLSAMGINAALKSKEPTKTRRLFDGGGLYLEISPTASAGWRLKYRHEGREKRISFGPFPAVSLREAREKRDDARKLIRQGIDPSAERQASRSAGADCFEAVAREWFMRHAPTWKESHARTVIRRLERDVFPYVGTRRMETITAPDVLALLRRIEGRGAVETAHRVQQIVGQVFRYAIATGRAERDPTGDLRGALTPAVVTHRPAITDAAPLGELLRSFSATKGQPTTAWALRLAPLVFVRPGELRTAEWSEIDLDAATWVIPSAKVKASTQDHVVPLSRQAVAILRDAHVLTGRGRYVFPSIRTNSRPMSDMTLGAALRRLGFAQDEVCIHGFRATARTMLAETLGFRAELIEHQLAHAVRDPLGRAYNRTAFIDERRAMMQTWADYLDGITEGAVVVPLRRVNV